MREIQAWAEEANIKASSCRVDLIDFSWQANLHEGKKKIRAFLLLLKITNILQSAH